MLGRAMLTLRNIGTASTYFFVVEFLLKVSVSGPIHFLSASYTNVIDFVGIAATIILAHVLLIQ